MKALFLRVEFSLFGNKALAEKGYFPRKK